MRAWSFAVVACAVALAGCGDDDGATMTDAGVDAAAVGTDAGRDAGGRDAARPDAGPGDPCEASDTNAIDTVGCNGAPIGAGVAANDFGGLCTPDPMSDQGSCTAMTDFCAARMGVAAGICLRGCDPGATYVSTSNCPMGSRCFTFDDGMGGMVGICYPDCTMPSDCTSNSCDGEGSCAPPMTVPGDGGVPMTDAGVPTDGGTAPTDAGVPATDAGVPATDAGVPATDAG